MSVFSQESVKPLYEECAYLRPSAALEHRQKEKKNNNKKKEDRDEQRH